MSKFKSIAIITLTTVTLNALQAETQEGIEEVLVVGSKLNETRQELSSSLGYFDKSRLENESIFNVEDIFDRTANAFTGTTGFGAYSIRGVNNNGVAGSLNNSNALASVLVNQVALGINSGDYIKPALFDAESVEILRGPQSAIQGPNSLIGAIYTNYRRPSLDGYDGRVRARAGEFNSFDLAISQNVVIAKDKVAARFVIDNRESDGDVTNTVTGADDVQREDQLNLRAAVHVNPLNNDSLTFDLSYLRVDSDTNPFGLVIAPPGGDLFDREQPFSTEDDYPAEFDQFALETNWRINNALSLTSITGYNDFNLVQEFDGDLSPGDFLTVTAPINEELFSQEFRVKYTQDWIEWLAGAFYSDGDYNNGFSGVGIFPDGMGGVAPFNTETLNNENIEQLAVFGKVNWRPVDRLQLSLGLRWNDETRTNDNFADNNGIVSDLQANVSFQQFIPSGSVTFDFNDQASLGFSYARGFQAGGIAFAVFQGVAEDYDEEFTDNFELFWRYQSEDGQFLVNANIFYIDWQDQQVVFTVPGGFPGFDDLVENAGSSSVQGLEVEAEWAFAPSWSSFLSIGITDTEFDEFTLNGVDLSGTPFPQSPDFNIALSVSYEPSNGVFGSGTFSYVDSTFTEIAAPEITQISSRQLLSGRVGYKTERWRAFVWGTNLLDDEFEEGLFDGTAFGIVGAYGRAGAPRTLGVGLEFTWQ